MDLKLQRKSKAIYAFLMALFSVWGWGQVIQHTFAATSGNITSNISFASAQNSSSTAPAIFTDGLRLYPGGANGGGSVTITPTNGIVITKVKFFATQTQPIRYSINGGTAVSMASSSTYEITGTISSSLRLNNANTGTSGGANQLRLSGVEVTYQTPTSNPPIVTASSFTGSVGTVFTELIQATEGPTSYTLISGSNLPSGLTLNTATGEISGTPTSAGSFTTNITATNSIGTSNPAAISFTINKGNQTINGFANQTKFVSSPSFTFSANTDGANLPITYMSSNPSVATISGNTITIAGVGTTNITATQAGNNDWNSFSQQIILTVAADPITYNGVGRFEKITSLLDLTDGYYVFVGDTSNAMLNSISSSKLSASNVSAINNVITNPSVNIVWKIQTDAGNIKTIYNESIDRYVSGGGSNTNISLATSVSGSGQKWQANTVSNLFRFTNVTQTGRALWYNGSVFGQYSTTNISGYYDLELFKRIETTIWNGTSWSNGAPDAKDVIITGSYSTASQPSFTAKNITIKNGGVLEITSGNTISALDVTVEDGGNLIQKDGSVLSYTGAFKALKNGTSEVNKYAFWSSPVVNQNLTNMYTAGTPAFITVYDTATDSYVNAASTTSVFAKAYSIKTPVANAALVFAGNPNTGTQTYTLATSGNGFNLIGNPYPSSLSLGAFYTANAARISSTFYFWDNKSTNVTLQNGATTTNYGYATFNAANSANPTWVPAPNGNGGTAVVPTGAVANIGQGFIVKTLNTSVDTSLTFNNEMRGATNGTFFNKNNSATEGKFWLRLNSEYNTNNTFAVDYTDGASDSFDNYDSKAIGMGSDGFYTLADSQKLIIQGKASFDINDVVPVGLKHFQNGNFTIALVQKEGLFNNGQAIYLHDKITGAYTDLQNNAYTFTANAGETADRFEIVYKLNVLATAEIKKDTFEVFRDGQDFVVRNDKNVEKVEIFDAAGRKIQTINENSKVIRVQLSSKGVYILKALSQGKEYTKKIFK